MNEQLNLSNEIILNVDTFGDQNDGSEVDGLSLRDALILASSDPQNKYTINLEAGTYNLFLPDGSLNVTNNVKIVGVSPEETIIDGTFSADSIFNLNSFEETALTLENVTLQNSPVSGIEVNSPAAKVVINNSVIRNNQRGGIVNLGKLELNDSMVLNNLANAPIDPEEDTGGYFAGGISNIGTGIMTISNSTVAFNNSLGGPGGILNDFIKGDLEKGGTLTVINSTISGNSSTAAFVGEGEDGSFVGGFGGGILATKDLETGDDAANLATIVRTSIINSTIANNQASSDGAGLFSQENSLFSNNFIVRNSIVANNIGGADVEGLFNDASSYNLIGSSSSNLVNGLENNIVGSADSPVDPLLTPLRDNGGPTLTHALLQGSPALDAGENSVVDIRSLFTISPVTDQRGSERISNGTVDRGSYELFVEEVSGNSNNSANALNTSATNSSSNNSQSPLDTPIYRFQNQNQPGTYLYVGEAERQNIKANFPQFEEEGFAFNVAVEPGDNLMTIYRFHNNDVPGTYLYVGEQERQSISLNNTNFREEGIAFYVYEADASLGEDIYRLQNTLVPGTYLYVGEQERQTIFQNFTNFTNEGVAFEVTL
jgi:hypothetical protein